MKNKFLKIVFGILLAVMPFSLSAEEMGIADPARDKYYSALEGKKVAYVPLAMGFDLTEGWYAGMKTALEPLGIEMILRDPNWSADAGSKAISSLISEKPDVMVVGSDWKGKSVIGSYWAADLKFFDRIEDYATTKTIKGIIDRG